MIKIVKLYNDLSEFNMYPNPFHPNEHVLTFTGLPENSEIIIYTVTSKIVATLNSNENNYCVWDGKLETGETVASGVYFIVITGSNAQIVRKLGLIK